MLCGTGYTDTALRGQQLRGTKCACVKWMSLLRGLLKLKCSGKYEKMEAKVVFS